MSVVFLVNTKIKADTKLTVVMWCQNFFYRKSIAPSSRDFRRRPPPQSTCLQVQKFWRFFYYSKLLTEGFFLYLAPHRWGCWGLAVHYCKSGPLKKSFLISCLLKRWEDLRSIGERCVLTSVITDFFLPNNFFGWWWNKPSLGRTAYLTII